MLLCKTLNRITKYYDESGMKLEKPEHVIQITTPKREASNRYIPMTDDVTEAFAIWKRKQEYDKKFELLWRKLQRISCQDVP